MSMTSYALNSPEHIKQRTAALKRANEIRTSRAVVKREIKNGTLSLLDVILATPSCLDSATITEVLSAVPRFGKLRARNILERAAVGATRRTGDLTVGERSRLLEVLAVRAPDTVKKKAA